VEAQTTRQRLVELRTVRADRGVAVVTCHYRIDQISAAVDWRLRCCRGRTDCRKQGGASKKYATVHPRPSVMAGARRPPHPRRPPASFLPELSLPTRYHQKTKRA